MFAKMSWPPPHFSRHFHSVDAIPARPSPATCGRSPVRRLGEVVHDATVDVLRWPQRTALPIAPCYCPFLIRS